MEKEEAEKIVAEARERGIAFVEDDVFITDDRQEIYSPEVNTVEAELWLLDTLMSLNVSD